MTRTPRGPSSVASDFVSALTAALLAAYAACSASPRCDARDEMFTMHAPEGAVTANCRQRSATAVTFVSMIARQFSSHSSPSTGVGSQIPALFTRM